MSSSANISANIMQFIMFLLLGVLLVIIATVVAVVYITYTEGELGIGRFWSAIMRMVMSMMLLMMNTLKIFKVILVRLTMNMN